MNCIFIIAGREAVPVRAIPFVDGWRSFTPDEVARGLARRNDSGKLEGLTAHYIASDESISAMLPKEWDAVVDALDELSMNLKKEGRPRSEWREKSVRELPSHCFVWRDELEGAAGRWWWAVHIVGEREGDKALNFAPWMRAGDEDAVFEGVPRSEAASPPVVPESAEKADSAPADNDAELAALFDSVRAPTLEALFPDGGGWKKYAERAARNGLESARTSRGMFNPYLAARWWLEKQAPAGWKWERCARVLANSLPARSRDSKHLLTGDYD